jgi:hypothetical protein
VEKKKKKKKERGLKIEAIFDIVEIWMALGWKGMVRL